MRSPGPIDTFCKTLSRAEVAQWLPWVSLTHKEAKYWHGGHLPLDIPCLCCLP